MDSSQREEGARGAAYRRPPLPGREFPLPCCGRPPAASGAAEMSMYSCSSPALLQEMRICGWKLMPPAPLTLWLIWSPYFLGASRATRPGGHTSPPHSRDCPTRITFATREASRRYAIQPCDPGSIRAGDGGRAAQPCGHAEAG